MTSQDVSERHQGEFLNSCDKSGNIIEVYKYGEDYIPAPHFRLGKVEDPRIHMPRLHQMIARDDDIILCAYMKAGTHWVWEIITMLTRGTAEYAPGPKEDCMLEFRSVEKLEAIQSPRVFNTHLRFSNLPKDMIERKCKIVFVVRNPKDIAVSMYNHLSKGKVFGYKGTFDDFLSLFQSDIVPHNPWAEYMAGWENDLTGNPIIPHHIVYYEDLKQKTSSEVKRLATFLGVHYNEPLIKDISDKCSFTKLKARKQFTKGEPAGNFLYRKGAVGDWKNWFTVAQNEEFDNFLKDKTNHSMFKYKYSL